MKNFWKRLEAWVIGLRRRPFFSARVKLASLYVLNAIIILGLFTVILEYFQFRYLESELEGVFAVGIDGTEVIHTLHEELRAATVVLVVFALMAIGMLSYFFMYITLRPIRIFVESQRRFISDASHELRTPLATIKAENEVALLEPQKLSRDEALSVLHSNVEEIDRISTILNSLLSLASFNSVTGTPPFSAVDIVEITKKSINRVKFLADRKKLRLTLAVPESLMVWGNAITLSEVISNLLENSIQYTPKDGEVAIRIRLRNKDRKAELVVQDTGVGIPAKDLPYIFEPFYRSDKSFHMYQQGSGLGLSMAREIIHRHGGSINIRSKSDSGTVVTVSLPLARVKN